MSVVVPLPECRARPDTGATQWLLDEHLSQVAAGCGNPSGPHEEQLAFLAGLLHDAGKCQAGWQSYVRAQTKNRPAHAPLGAVLFAWLAEGLISTWAVDSQKKQRLRDLLVDWTRVIYCHHDELDDLDTRPPWEKAWSTQELTVMLHTCDLAGLMELVRSYFPDLRAEAASFADWLEGYGDVWERHVRFFRTQSPPREHQHPCSVHVGLRLPQLCANLVSADRYHAGQFHAVGLDPDEARSALLHLHAFCKTRAQEQLAAGAAPRLIAARAELQHQAVARYKENATSTFFSLTLPTGYGKTLTSIRVALEAVAEARCNRIVFVAPYLSILSQAAEEIHSATSLPLLQHHSLALLQQRDDDDVEALDSWQAPVLLTTFNQLFRVLFPRRAQHSVRARALREAFVIIDEPQIIDVAVWNLFLYALGSACNEWRAQVLFNTATLPPTSGGLEQTCLPLNDQVPAHPRYQVHFSPDPMQAEQVADWVRQHARRHRALAVVVNTVADAVEVYSRLRQLDLPHACALLTAVMLPGHKDARIQEIRQLLKNQQPAVVVCTQMLEAGVDLSFERILRALPVFPAVAQVAGRANRHGESDIATVEVFPYLRPDGKDSRQHVYTDSTARRQTDALLSEHQCFSESDTTHLLATYFARCWQENAYQACLQRLENAAIGKWSDLAGLEPFAQDYSRVEVFVPCGADMVPTYAQSLLAHYAPEGPGQLLALLADGRTPHCRSFEDRKRILTLVHCFTVPVHRQLANSIAHQFNDWLWVLNKPEDYSPETGLAGLSAQPESTEVII
ncbi:MAG: CRISPR-associated helicase Cas3' [candidate division KSB1 bacterium]|nr:CRISPR-associated helicase Cas3' [candidate division KSB1 bacterium]